MINARDLLNDLQEFYHQLKVFNDLLEARDSSKMRTSHEDKELQRVREEIVRKGGRLKAIVVRLTGKQFGQQFGQVFDVWAEALGASSYPPLQKWSLGALTDNVNEAIGRLEGGASVDVALPSELPLAFIAHGGGFRALNKLKDFLYALGIEPLILEEQPSKGRSIDENVEYYLDQADCAIVLATKGDIDGQTGEFLPRGNILIEIGRFQERFPEKTVYLLEEDTRFPSNVNEKV